ncbi:MAG: serine/threonine-protein phosphatase [Phycisphaeraceae bacterium]|nr:serine/threonine-protein phosphatase [Phycisphaeraceae bacterium]
MSRGESKSVFTSEFGGQFEAERAKWLRRRFLWYTGVVAVWGVITVFATSLYLWFGRPLAPTAHELIVMGLSLVTSALYVAGFLQVYGGRANAREVLSIAYWLIVLAGFLSLITVILTVEFKVGSLSSRSATAGEHWDRGAAWVFVRDGLKGIFVSHVFACFFLPWTPRECYRPLVPLLIAYAIVAGVYFRHSLGIAALVIGTAPLVGVPGAGICWWRHSWFRERFMVRMLRGQYWEMRRELTDARRIHESLFPKPITTGPVRLHYKYEPMLQIGGDYLYARFSPARVLGGVVEPAAFNLVLLDVTGHGIAAALTVNRLYGELERLFGEDPNAPPGEVLRALNRYVHLTLATHSVYATALCIRVDQSRGVLEYASGGHPPAFLRAVDGTIEELSSTAFVLGAATDDDYDPAPVEHRFVIGDTLLAYTDGAIEARNEAGRALGVAGLQGIIAAASKRGVRTGQWIDEILGVVEGHREGPPSDDTIIVEVSRAVPTPEDARRKTDSRDRLAAHPAGVPGGRAG